MTFHLALALLIAAGPAFGNLTPWKSRNSFLPQIKPAVTDCSDIDGVFEVLYALEALVVAEMEGGMQNAKDTIGGPAAFDDALQNLEAYNYDEIVKAYEIFFRLSAKHPVTCKDYPWLFSGWTRHGILTLERAAGSLSSIAFLKGRPEYDLVKADVETRLARVRQEVSDMNEVVVECTDIWCEIFP